MTKASDLPAAREALNPRKLRMLDEIAVPRTEHKRINDDLAALTKQPDHPPLLCDERVDPRRLSIEEVSEPALSARIRKCYLDVCEVGPIDTPLRLPDAF